MLYYENIYIIEKRDFYYISYLFLTESLHVGELLKFIKKLAI